MSFTYCKCNKPVRRMDLPGWCEICDGRIDEMMQKVAVSMQEVHDLDLQPVSRRSSPIESIGNRTPTHYGRHRNKTGRNESCPCYSGKKFKHCCGRN